MLVLTVKLGQTVLIGDNIKVKLVKLKSGFVKLAFEAPQSLAIDRLEVRERKDAERAAKANPAAGA